MIALLLALVACSSDIPCDGCRGDSICVEQLRGDGSLVAECQPAPASCADVFVDGVCSPDVSASSSCRTDAGAFCPTLLPDHGGFTCVTGGGYDYLDVLCEDR